MKKLFFLTPLFLIGFGVALGITCMATASAEAGEPCTSCAYELYCSTTTGPLCTDPEHPYYLYEINGWCRDGNPHHYCLDNFIGCCFPWD